MISNAKLKIHMYDIKYKAITFLHILYAGLKNYFVLVHKRKQWICRLEPETVKHKFLETLAQTIAKQKAY